LFLPPALHSPAASPQKAATDFLDATFNVTFNATLSTPPADSILTCTTAIAPDSDLILTRAILNFEVKQI